MYTRIWSDIHWYYVWLHFSYTLDDVLDCIISYLVHDIYIPWWMVINYMNDIIYKKFVSLVYDAFYEISLHLF